MKTPMCAQRDEVRWLDFLEGQLQAGEARAFEDHLAVCPECQAFCRDWRQLEIELETSLPRPAFSPDFTARLWARIEPQAAEAASAAKARQRQQLETELQAAWAQWRRQFLRAEIPDLLDGLGYGVVAALGGYFLLRFLMTTVLQNLAQPSHSLTAFGVPAGIGAGALLLLGTLWYAGRNQFSRLLKKL